MPGIPGILGKDINTAQLPHTAGDFKRLLQAGIDILLQLFQFHPQFGVTITRPLDFAWGIRLGRILPPFNGFVVFLHFEQSVIKLRDPALGPFLFAQDEIPGRRRQFLEPAAGGKVARNVQHPQVTVKNRFGVKAQLADVQRESFQRPRHGLVENLAGFQLLQPVGPEFLQPQRRRLTVRHRQIAVQFSFRHVRFILNQRQFMLAQPRPATDFKFLQALELAQFIEDVHAQGLAVEMDAVPAVRPRPHLRPNALRQVRDFNQQRPGFLHGGFHRRPVAARGKRFFQPPGFRQQLFRIAVPGVDGRVQRRIDSRAHPRRFDRLAEGAQGVHRPWGSTQGRVRAGVQHAHGQQMPQEHAAGEILTGGQYFQPRHDRRFRGQPQGHARTLVQTPQQDMLESLRFRK